ncbi:coenzyme F430 synthase [Methanolobus sediminis]|uniref:Coenzyme F430 synthase n=1 Tax=Methanolobus sediminis TaxID=3072978 RepID=A0AA51UL11_9EURY|nr:coenzyme F430 synthase [Methanolobus sediminis]WMW25521.1 coenzyme F430 synthase [Methanolobus sediminis]
MPSIDNVNISNMKFQDTSGIIVLDLTHAGIIIATKLAEMGYSVTAVDVYRTVNENVLLELEGKYGIQTSKEPVPISDNDLVVSPAHLDPEYPVLVEAREKGIRIVTHHQAVGSILSMNGWPEKGTVIEITGSKAKTSSASLLAEMLSQKMKVVLHTSRGLELWENGQCRILNLGLSIAPGSILLAIDKMNELEVSAECYIFEVSIGLTGFADIGIITTLEPDYPIAASTSNSSDAKMNVLSYAREDEVFFLNVKDRKAQDMANDLGKSVFTFGDSEYSGQDYENADVVADIVTDNGYFSLKIKHQTGTFSSSLSEKYNSRSYATAFAVSTAVALNMGISEHDIIEVIGSFEGLQGRMQEKELAGRILIDNSNSGMDIRSAERSLDYALNRIEDKDSGVIMVLGEEAAQVCEGLPPEQVSEFVKQRNADLSGLILVGERMQNIGNGNSTYASGLEEGLEIATGMASEKDIIISCVKCFR